MFTIFAWPFKLLGLPFKAINLLYKLSIIAVVAAVLIWFFDSQAHAACFGSKHIIGTSGSKQECIYKAQQKLSREQSIQDQGNSFLEPEPLGGFAGEIYAMENAVRGRGQNYVKRIGYDKKHALQIDWGIYYLPSEVGYRRQFTSHFAPSAFTYHYYINPSFSVGMKYQAYKLEGTPFSSGMGSDSLDIMRWWSQGTFHFDISKGTQAYAQLGMIVMDSSRVWLNGNPKDDSVGEDQFMAEFGLAFLIGSNHAVAGLRFTDAPNGSQDITTYHNFGGAELFGGIVLGLF